MFERNDSGKIISGAQPQLEALLRRFERLSEDLESSTEPDSSSNHYREMTKILDSIQELCLSGDLFEKYKLKLKANGSVEFLLPRGASFHDLFNECNEYSHRRWGCLAVGASVFSKSDDRPVGYSIEREIIGVVPGSNMKSRLEQGNLVGSLRLLVPTLDNAVAAGALYFCRTGQDLFAGMRVRTAGEVAISLGAKGIEIDSTARSWEAAAGVACAGTPIVG